MKLYTIVKSERASKGQGGNKHLNIDILIYDRNNPLYTIEITPEKLIFRERGYSQPLLERSHKDIKEQEERIAKGNMSSEEARIQAYEAKGLTRSDAQGVIEAEDMKTKGDDISCENHAYYREDCGECRRLNGETKGEKKKGEEIHSHDWNYISDHVRECTECGEIDRY